MYERHFGFREKPFSLLPDPAFLYLGQQHSEAWSLLEYSLASQAGFTVVTGEIGCGKTTLIRHLLNHLDQGVTVGLLSNTHGNLRNLLSWVLMAFGLEYEAKGAVRAYDSFVEFLISEYAGKRRVVLIVDEAQNLDAAALEELRTLSNVNADKDQLLQLILVGQPELERTLQCPELRQLAQRVVAHFHLTPFSEDETAAYIRHRLECAGGSPELFSVTACRRVHQYAKGVPRLINLLCDTALVYGFAEDAGIIGEDLVESVITERAAGLSLGSRDSVNATSERRAGEKALPAKPAYDEEKEKVVEFNLSDARQLFSHLVKPKSGG